MSNQNINDATASAGLDILVSAWDKRFDQFSDSDRAKQLLGVIAMLDGETTLNEFVEDNNLERDFAPMLN